MKLKDHMSTQVITIAFDADLVEAARLMRKHHIGFLVVVRPTARGGECLAGVLTDRDIVIQTLARDIDPHALTVQDVMTPDPLTGKEDEDLTSLLARMRRAGIRRVPVVNTAGMLRGVLSLDDILKAVAQVAGLLADTLRLGRRFEKRKRAA